MRLRKAKLEHENIRIDLDFRNTSSIPMQAIAIVGGNMSGKTLLMHCALKLFQSTAQSGSQIRAFEKKIQATIEFEYEGGIHVGVIRDGIIIQKPMTTQMKIDKNKISDGCLFYDFRSRLNASLTQCYGFGQATCYMALKDLYKNEIRNCLIWIDDFDVGLDDENAVTLFRAFMRKSYERDNQLIVSGHRAKIYDGLGENSVKFLVSPGDMMNKFIKII